MTVADAMVRSLQRLGVRHIFGLPGSTEGPLLHALADVDSPAYVLGLHENIAAAMADGYARASGDMSVVSLHTSVGTGNAVSQIMNAFVDRSPVVALIGHKDARLANRDGFCTVEDLSGMLRPFTKWSREVADANLAVEDLERAALIATTRPRGPVALVITEDKARARFDRAGDGQPAPGPATVGGYRPDCEGLEAAARALASAQRPLLIAGDGVAWTGASRILEAVAETFGCPILQEPRRSASRMNCSTEHPNFCGEYSPDHPAARDADVILAVGARIFVEFEPVAASELPAGAYFIHIHEDPAELGKRYTPDLGLIGTASDALADLRALAEEMGHRPRKTDDRLMSLRRGFKRRIEDSRATSPDEHFGVAAVSRILDDELPSDVMVFDEGVRSSRVLLQHLSLPGGRSYHRSTGGAIGWGLPAAIGAQIACPDRRVVLFVGDGSALLTIQALWTAARYEVPVTVLIANNRGYQAVQAAVEKQQGQGARAVAVGAVIDQPAPSFVRLAEGFGVSAVSVGRHEELRLAIKEAGNTPGPSVIELALSGREHVGATSS
ncbi:MAG: hypothetical protein GEU81_06025 [Nitriliruptorales bacterium]|nr:hypothetical protein [Nitriliruptorales bacterium]